MFSIKFVVFSLKTKNSAQEHAKMSIANGCSFAKCLPLNSEALCNNFCRLSYKQTKELNNIKEHVLGQKIPKITIVLRDGPKSLGLLCSSTVCFITHEKEAENIAQCAHCWIYKSFCLIDSQFLIWPSTLSWQLSQHPLYYT